MQFKTRFLVFGLALSVLSCNSESNVISIDENQPIDSNFTVKDVDASAQLMINNCYACHNPNTTESERIAPTLSHIKQKYLEKNISQKGFISFVSNPNIDNAVLKGAVNKFGVMPNMQFPLADIEQIANYLYSTDIETDEWTAKYYSGKAIEPTFEEGDYMGLGRHIAMSTKKELGKNLKSTIKNKGTLEAVKYCNVRALPITDSMATKYNANITRISDKQRNPNNTTNSTEKSYIETYQTQLNNQLELKPILNETKTIATFYMPIVTNDMCLQCHGTPNSIENSVLAEINTLYPKDKATGYDINQIRGLWKIELKK